MFLSKYRVFIPLTNESSTSMPSLGIANAVCMELLSYNIDISGRVYLAISKLTNEDAFWYGGALLERFTVGELTPAHGPNYYRQHLVAVHSTHNKNKYVIYGHPYLVSGNDMADPTFMTRISMDLADKVAKNKPKEITLATNAEAMTALEDLIGSSAGMSRQQAETMFALASSFRSTGYIKSDRARVIMYLASHRQLDFNRVDAVDAKLKPADVMRYFAAKRDLSQINLPSKVMYAPMSWQDRTEAFDFLTTFSRNDLMEAMSVNQAAWKRFFSHMHLFSQRDFKRRPGLLACVWVSQGSKLDEAHPALTKDLKAMLATDLAELTPSGNLVYRSFASRMMSAIEGKKFKKIKALCDMRPNYLLRNITTVANGIKSKRESDFLGLVAESITKANSNVLFSLAQIGANSEYRVIDVKGDTVIQKADYSPLLGRVQQVAEAEIKSRYSVAGQVTCTDTVKNMAVPFLSSNQTLHRGTKVAIDGKRYLYVFCHWMEARRGYREDIDLSVVLLKDSGGRERFEVLNYSQQAVGRANDVGLHSGDYQTAPAPSGATEYVRIDLHEAARQGYTELTPVINVYAGTAFDEQEVAYAGFMLSDSETFQISNKHNRYDLNQPAKGNIPFLCDLREGEMMITDFNQRNQVGITAHSYKTEITKLKSAMATSNIMTVGRLCELLSGEGSHADYRVKMNPTNPVRGTKAAKEMAPDDLQKFIKD